MRSVKAGTNRCISEPRLRPLPCTTYTAIVCVLTAIAAVTPAFAAQDAGRQWVSAWQGSPTPGGTFFSPGCPSDVGLNNQTIRNLIFTGASGNRVRVRISNFAGSTPLSVGSASLALSAGGAAVVSDSLTPLQFGGNSSILIAAGGEALSDPIDMKVKPQETLVVTIYLPGKTGLATQHYYADQDNYLASGDQSAVSAGTAFTQKISCWMFLSGVEVEAPLKFIGTLIALGDSITDGYLSTNDANRRYPDFLARRFLALSSPTLAVVNAGIIGNELLTIRPQLEFGYTAPYRLFRDVFAQPGARAVILLEGINDIGDRSAKAEDLIPVDLQIIAQSHAMGLKVFGGTLLPFMGSNKTYGGDYGTAAGEAERQKLNQWIRTSGAFDGVVDFDKAVRDPSNPSALLPAYDGDHLHPNDAGYQAMANAVKLDAIIDAVTAGASE